MLRFAFLALCAFLSFARLLDDLVDLFLLMLRIDLVLNLDCVERNIEHKSFGDRLGRIEVLVEASKEVLLWSLLAGL